MRSSGSAVLAPASVDQWSSPCLVRRPGQWHRVSESRSTLQPPRVPLAGLGWAGPGSARCSVSSGPPWLPPFLPIVGGLFRLSIYSHGTDSPLVCILMLTYGTCFLMTQGLFAFRTHYGKYRKNMKKKRNTSGQPVSWKH